MSEHGPHSHCSYCGAPFPVAAHWPRRCAGCGNTSFRNPIPVTVLLIPVGAGLVVVQRGLPPAKGAFALPGGYIEWGESWQEAGAREAREEAGVTVDPASIHVVTVFSASDGTLIIVGKADPISAELLPPFSPSRETSERRIITAAMPLAWPLHTEVVARYFAGSETSASR